jgi:hypothetical protein
MDPVSTEVLPPDSELARRLFTSPEEEESSSKRESPNKRAPLHKPKDVWSYKAVGVTGRKKRNRVGFCGALIFLSLCLAALVLTIQFNSWGLYTITSEGKTLWGLFLSPVVSHSPLPHTSTHKYFLGVVSMNSVIPT